MTTDQNELRERVISYVRHQVEKGPEGIRQAILKGYDQLHGLIDGLSEEQAAFKPSPDDWCVLEVLQHVVESKQKVARRSFALARGETAPPVTVIGTVEGQVPATLAESRTALEKEHRELLRFVESLSPETNVEAKQPHPWFGPLDCREWAVFERVHDGDHANQILEIKGAPAFPPT